MTARRLSEGGEIDRDRGFAFSFDGRRIEGLLGDSLASALLASGIAVLGRSVKYHRPRGLWGAWVEEPNILLDVTADGRHRPNQPATTEFPTEGSSLVTRSVNTRPSAARDLAAVLDRLGRFLPAGFYYKTFMWPDWHLFEPRIRALAGLGRLDPDWRPPPAAAPRSARADFVVVGGGPAGLAFARAVARAGRDVLLLDDRPRIGGSLRHRAAQIEGLAGVAWAERTAAEIRAAGGRLLTDTTAFGLYDHNLLCLLERRRDGRSDRLWRLRAGEVVLATGALERPLVFGDNDRPGILSADAALSYLRRQAVLPGRRLLVATNNDSAYEAAFAMAEAGAEVAVLDSRREGGSLDRAERAGLAVHRGLEPERALGRRGLTAVVAGGQAFPAEALLVSGGWTPSLQLYGQARGRLVWSEALGAFLPGEGLPGLTVIGAAAGEVGLGKLLAAAASAAARLTGARVEAATCAGPEASLNLAPHRPHPGAAGRAFIDLQNDVTLADLELAAREGFGAVEHLKRYTTLGMASDQGKTSNVNGLAALAATTGRPVAEIGTTSFRPPYTPVPFDAIAGAKRGELFAPLKRLALEPEHRAAAAVLKPYGGWLRPACYGAGATAAEIRREAETARLSLGLLDASPLGKVEVMGPQAAAFLDFNCYNRVSDLAVGRIRYVLLLSESGVVFDDGVVLRLGQEHFLVSCSSAHAEAVAARFETWRQDAFDRRRLFIHDSTSQWATLTASGPSSRELFAALGLGLAVDDARLPHMSFLEASFAGDPVRLARVSFTGDRAYEITLPCDRAEALWAAMRAAGKAFGATLLGLEALSILRAEKGYILVGKDSDGETLPQDLGMTGPLARRGDEYIGKRSLFTEAARRGNRRQLVGLAVEDGLGALPVGAHAVEAGEGGALRSLGYVTSSCESPTLGRPIALALIERGRERQGERLRLRHLGEERPARIVAPCAFDPRGDRLHA